MKERKSVSVWEKRSAFLRVGSLVSVSDIDSLAVLSESKMAFEKVAELGILKAEMKALQADA